MDDRYATQHYRHGWLLGFGPPGSRPSLAHVDHQTGRTSLWHGGEARSLQEPCFIPKSPRAPEGEGYLVQVQPHLNDGLADLLLFDAQQVAEGPMATIHLPLRMRFGLHGNWVPGAALANARSTAN